MSTTLALSLTEGTSADLQAAAAPAVVNVSAPPPAPALACPSQSPRRRKAGTAVALSLVLHLTLAGALLLWRPVFRAPSLPLDSSVVFLDLREMSDLPEPQAVVPAAEGERTVATDKKIDPSPIMSSAKVRAAGRKVALAPRAAAEPVGEPTAPPVIDAGDDVVASPAAVSAAAASSAVAPVSDAPPGEAELIPARPHARHSPAPPYPEAARRRGQQGLVHLAAEVAADGRVQALELAESCGYALLDRAALAAVREWIFEPARRRGVAETARVVVPVRFELH